MIDEKKIEEAQEEIFEDKFHFNGEYIMVSEGGSEPHRVEVYGDGQIKEAFKAGANWAINEFLKSLWHDASEEPKVGLFAPCVIQLQSDCEGSRFAVHDYHKNCGFSSPKGWLDKEEIIRWAYVSDLFPKQVEPKK